MDTLVGKTLSHCRIVEKIGAGGMGEVYLAQCALRPLNAARRGALGGVTGHRQPAREA